MAQQTYGATDVAAEEEPATFQAETPAEPPTETTPDVEAEVETIPEIAEDAPLLGGAPADGVADDEEKDDEEFNADLNDKDDGEFYEADPEGEDPPEELEGGSWFDEIEWNDPSLHVPKVGVVSYIVTVVCFLVLEIENAHIFHTMIYFGFNLHTSPFGIFLHVVGGLALIFDFVLMSISIYLAPAAKAYLGKYMKGGEEGDTKHLLKHLNLKWTLLFASGAVFFCVVGMLGVFTFLNFFASLMLACCGVVGDASKLILLMNDIHWIGKDVDANVVCGGSRMEGLNSRFNVCFTFALLFVLMQVHFLLLAYDNLFKMKLFKEHDFDEVEDDEEAEKFEKEENENRAMLDKFYASKVIDTTAVEVDEDEDAPEEAEGALVPTDEQDPAGSPLDPPAVEP